MKKLLSILTLGTLLSICIPAKEIILKSDPCEFKKIEYARFEKLKTSLSDEEIEKDLDTLCYLISCGYAGYENMISKGYNSDIFYESVLKNLEEKRNPDTNEFNSRDFYFEIVKGLKPYINDSHFIITHFKNSKSFSIRTFCAWSDIYVEKKKAKDRNRIYDFVVTESDNPLIKKGDLYTGGEERLFYYPVKGKNIYRIGIMKESQSGEITECFSFNGKNIPLNVKQDGVIEQRPMKYKEIASENSAYIELNDYFLPDANSLNFKTCQIIFDKFIKLGKKYNDKKYIILDMRGNHGGDSSIPAAFLYCLYCNYDAKNTSQIINQMSNWTMESFSQRRQVNSPCYYQVKEGYYGARNNVFWKNELSKLVEKSKINSERIITQNKLTPSRLFSKGSKFKGKLIILNDRNTVSAGEFTSLLAKEILEKNNVYVIGENTYGMAEYWNVLDVQLPCSKIVIHTSFGTNETFRNHEDWHGEGRGLYPDYWCIGSDINETIFMITDDDEMKEKLKDIEFKLL